MADDQERGVGRAHERLERLAGGNVEVVRGLVEEEQVRRQQEEQRQLQARALAAGERPDFLEHVVAAEQEAGQVAARRALSQRHLVEERVEDRRAGDRRVAELGQVGELDVLAEIQDPVERRSSPAIVRSSVVLPAPFGPTMPTRSPRRSSSHGTRATGVSWARLRPAAGPAAAVR